MYRKRHYQDDEDLTAKANKAVLEAINETYGYNNVSVSPSIKPFNPDERIGKRDIETFINSLDNYICATCVEFHFELTDDYLDFY